MLHVIPFKICLNTVKCFGYPKMTTQRCTVELVQNSLNEGIVLIEPDTFFVKQQVIMELIIWKFSNV